MPALRTRVYIDGYNLYYGCLRKTAFKWLDVLSLFETQILPSILYRPTPEAEPATLPLHPDCAIKYFTAKIIESAAKGEDSVSSQAQYHNALTTHCGGRLSFVMGHYSLYKANQHIVPADDPKRWPRDCDKIQVWKLEEKQSDVNLALHLYDDALSGEVDQVVLVTNDTDLTPALEMLKARCPHIVRGLVIPTRKVGAGGDLEREANVSLARLAHWVRRHISEDELRASQLPDVVPGRRRASVKPHSWYAKPHHLAKMLEMARPVLRTEGEILKWARRESAHLGGRRPIDLIETDAGAVEVFDYIAGFLRQEMGEGRMNQPADKALTSPDQHDDTHSEATWKPPRAGVVGNLVAVGLAAAGALSILAAWQLPPFATAIQGTEDAYIQGRTTVISPQASGYVSKVLVRDYQHVKRGEILIQIDDSIYLQQLDAAKAQVDVALANLANNDQAVASKRADVEAASAGVKAAQAALDKAAIDDKRASDLSVQGAGPLAQVDAARAELEIAQAGLLQANARVATAQEAVKSAEVQTKVLSAQVEVARAEQQQAEINLSHTLIKAPEDGQLSNIGVRLGQYVTNGSQLFFLVPDIRWVIANYKERQTASMLPGQTAYFTVDALGDRKFTGRVDEISPATGSEFSILRPDNATGNFTKVPQRIPVRIVPDAVQTELDRLRPGMSVEAYVDTEGAER